MHITRCGHLLSCSMPSMLMTSCDIRRVFSSNVLAPFGVSSQFSYHCCFLLVSRMTRRVRKQCTQRRGRTTMEGEVMIGDDHLVRPALWGLVNPAFEALLDAHRPDVVEIARVVDCRCLDRILREIGITPRLRVVKHARATLNWTPLMINTSCGARTAPQHCILFRIPPPLLLYHEVAHIHPVVLISRKSELEAG